MATLVLSAVGAAIGSSVGGAVLGVSSTIIGKAAGALIGSRIDQRIMGQGSAAVETGRVDTLRMMSGAEGAAVPRVFGRMRVSGQMIWSSRFLEDKNSSGGGKGKPTVTSYSYSISVAIALCEGEVSRIGRIWADGKLMGLEDVTWRLHKGSEDQLPDPLIEAVQGVDNAPAYRGTAYLVLENFQLAAFGNRIPQFSVEVYRRPQSANPTLSVNPSDVVKAVALVPGTGEYSLATTPVTYPEDKGVVRLANKNNPTGKTDIEYALDTLEADLPATEAVSLVVCWFGDDLRMDRCKLEPGVEQPYTEGAEMPWNVSGVSRSNAKVISVTDGGATFGGTPTDASIIEGIADLNQRGIATNFYPFILMDILPDNGLADPWSSSGDQQKVPWRGRITLSNAPGRLGSPDKTAAAAAEVAAFFGSAQVSDFSPSGNSVGYSGPSEWSYRRFILHNAHLCALAGGVEAFCIGSEMVGLTPIRDSADGFPAVAALKVLAADVRSILGPNTKIGYAADWTEYFGYHPQDGSGDVFFHLDPLWSDPNIDFIGIDNYMPMSDWRDTVGHEDAGWGTIYDLEYLKSNIAGGEGFDWYYATQTDRDQQNRQAITDGAYSEPWVFKYKDLVNWWTQSHHNRPGGVRDAQATSWVPQSKPIWFTEIGCPAADKGTNEPNAFVDPKSAESRLPRYSNGGQDDYLQLRYFQAFYEHWQNTSNNPVSASYGGPMVDTSRSFVWAWDARPWPDFPDRLDTWSDGVNYARGHWVSGRLGLATVAEVVAEVSEKSSFYDADVSALHGAVKGYSLPGPEAARNSIQPLMMSHAFDSFEQGEKIIFRSRANGGSRELDIEQIAVEENETSAIRFTRLPGSETSERVRVGFVGANDAYQRAASEANLPSAEDPTVSDAELSMALTSGEGQTIADRWLAEGEVARDQASFNLPPSALEIAPGDILNVPKAGGRASFRVDSIENRGIRQVEATRMEERVYQSNVRVDPVLSRASYSVAAPVYAEFMDLPLITGDEVLHAPHIAATSVPWQGPMAVYVSADNNSYDLNAQISQRSIIGTTVSDLPRGTEGLIMPGAQLRVKLPAGELSSVDQIALLNGANLGAIRQPGHHDWEVFQFRTAELSGLREFELGDLLRGQFGTDGIMPDVHEAGSDFVLLDGASVQANLPASSRGLERHYRVGPASAGYDSNSYAYSVKTTDGVGHRPFAPSHLNVLADANANLEISWIRRSRIDGDSWASVEVPLGEVQELYRVWVFKDGGVVRSWDVSVPNASYSQTDQTADGISAPFEIRVAQISEIFGPGPFARTTFDG